jgi:hypothetical protein
MEKSQQAVHASAVLNSGQPLKTFPNDEIYRLIVFAVFSKLITLSQANKGTSKND